MNIDNNTNKMLISCFVREQKHYTKNQLRTLFSYDNTGVEKFIKTLKSYGILKHVSYTTLQKELTDLVEEDFPVVDRNNGIEELEEKDKGYYVFHYVGVVMIGNRVIKIYPKYILSETEPVKKMKQVLKVLEYYHGSEEQIVHLFQGDGDQRSFNILAVILYFFHDYYENGIYNNTEDILEVNGEGEILWNRTIEDGFAIIQENRPYYTEFLTKHSVENEGDYMKRLHKYVLTDCWKQLQDSGLEELFDFHGKTMSFSEETLGDFGEKEYILERIEKELQVQFQTHRQILLRTLYAYLSQEQKMLEENQGIHMFGTTNFYKVWEKTCAVVFGNQLEVPIGQIPMKAHLSAGYDKKMKCIDLVEKPKWCGVDFVQQSKSTLIPDMITINEYQGQDCFLIFDAKYYLIQFEKDHTLKGVPGVGDVIKQYMYQLAYKKFLLDHHISMVKNCFLMPTEGEKIIDKGNVKLEMLSVLGLEDIQIRLLPAELIFDCYLKGKKIDVEMLKL